MASAPQKTDPNETLASGSSRPAAGTVAVRLWAAARAAAGTPELTVEVPGEVTVDWLRAEVARLRPDRDGLSRVMAVCSVLVGEQPAHDPEQRVPVGATVEFLPPFAGG